MKKKSLISLLLVAAMLLGLLAGCGGDTASAPAEETASAPVSEEAPVEETPVEESAVEEAPASVAEEPVVEEVVPAGPEAYYACEETTEISILFQYPAFFLAFFPEGWAASEFWAALGEKTNTTYTLREVSNIEWTENVNLLCAAGDLPDVVTNLGSVYSGGLPAAIADEQIYDLAPMIQEYAPNYFKSLQRDEYTLKTTISDDGQMGAMYPLLEEPFPVTSGLWIRQDWLDEQGKEIPTTTDELTEVLRLFSDNYGATVGLYQMIRPNTGDAFCAVEGVWNNFGPVNFYLEDGEIHYGPMEDHYYEYLAYLKSLAQEDLFLTSDMTDQTSNNLFASGLIGVEGDSPDNVPAYVSLLDPEEQAKCKLVPMQALGEPTEYSPLPTLISSDAGGNISISTNCDAPEVVLKAFDYLFTAEGSVLSSYGIEGTAHELVDGEPVLTELILSNPAGVPSRAAMGYWMNPGLPGLIDYARSQSAWDDVQRSAFDVWNAAYTGSSQTVDINALTLTDEERDAITVFKSDMITYVTEWANSVVFGDVELTDAEIEAFQTTMEETMHISEILEVYNDAYERFQNRSFE